MSQLERIVIVGSREWGNQVLIASERVKEIVNSLPEGCEVISGGANGVDKWAVFQAEGRGLPTKVIRPAWDIYGKKAAFIRNGWLLDEEPDLVAAVINSASKTQGALNTVKQANERGIPWAIHRPGTEV